MIYLIYVCVMISNTTISLNDKVKKAGQEKARDKGIRGGFSAYVETLIKADLKKDGLTFEDK